MGWSLLCCIYVEIRFSLEYVEYGIQRVYWAGCSERSKLSRMTETLLALNRI